MNISRKLSAVLFFLSLFWAFFRAPLRAAEMTERAALPLPKMTPVALTQVDFSIEQTEEKIGSVSDEIPSPLVGGRSVTSFLQTPRHALASRVRITEGRGEGERGSLPPHPSLPPQGGKGIIEGPKQLQETQSRIPKKNFSALAGLGSLSTIYDGAQTNMSAGGIEPEEGGDEGIFSKLSKPIQAIKTIGTKPARVNPFETVNYGEGFPSPQGVFADFSGLIYVADYENRRVQIFDPSGKYLKTLETSFHPTGVFVDPHGLIYVGDTSNHSIEIFDSSFKHLRTLGNGQWTSGNEGFKFPYDVFVDSKKQIYVVDTGNYRVQIFDYDGKYLHTLGTGKETSKNDGFGLPTGISANSAGLIYVGDSVNNRVQVFSHDWKYLRTIRIDGKTAHGSNIFVDLNERIYVADAINQRIQIYDPSGKPLRTLGTGKETSENDGFNHPTFIFVDSKGLIYVTDNHNHRIQIFPSLEEMDAADKKSQDEAERFLSQKVTIPPAPQPDSAKNEKPQTALEHFKIDW